jgi:FkbM family methyltransferase
MDDAVPRRRAVTPVAPDLPTSIDLVRSHLALEEARAKGDAAQVTALSDRLAAMLAEAARQHYARAMTCWAERQDRKALQHFDAALDAHRWNLPGLELPVSRSACLMGLSTIYAAWGQPFAVAAAVALALKSGPSVYRRPRLCQIPILEGLYEQLFGRRENGTFVEVGAFDGETYGNTAGLADLGWRGLYIEPVPAAFELCRKRHAHNVGVTVVNCAVGAEDGMARIFPAREFSTMSRDQIDRNIASGWMSQGAGDAIEVVQRRLATVLSEAGIAPGFELLVVDVEGAEDLVFQDFDLAQWRPQVMIVELADFAPGANDPLVEDAAAATSRRVRRTILAAGYDPVYCDFTNTVFRRAGAPAASGAS